MHILGFIFPSHNNSNSICLLNAALSRVLPYPAYKNNRWLADSQYIRHHVIMFCSMVPIRLVQYLQFGECAKSYLHEHISAGE